MNILVTFAVRAEFAPWQRRRNFLRVRGDATVFEAAFGGAKVRAVLTGMGPEHALAAAKRALSDKPDLCISTGLAGAAREGYRVGDVLAARLVSEVSEPVAVASHRQLLATAIDCGARQIERFATSSALIARPEQKRAIGEQAEAVDMESYMILAEAARCGVPALAVRAVSDTCEFEMPYDFAHALDAQGQIRTAKVLALVMRKPSGLRALMRLARDSRAASRRLALFLDAFIGTIADRLIPIEQDTVVAL
jgi:adenosylhomocysteine nucleosidase